MPENPVSVILQKPIYLNEKWPGFSIFKESAMSRYFHIYKRFIHGKAALILLLVCFAQQVGACPKDKPWKRVSRPEKIWAACHPFKAKRVMRCAVRARLVTDSLGKAGVLNDKNGGQLDAFRHAYWMALMIESGLPAHVARKVGEKHEKGNYLEFRKGKLEDSIRPDSMSSVMDLRNNEVGITIGKEFIAGDKSVTLIRLVIMKIWDGKLFILRKNSLGQYLDCEKMPIDPEKYKGKWNVPKCLDTSDKIVVPH